MHAFGRLDVLFNNAGIFYPHSTLDCSEEEWDLQIDINLKGTFLMSKFALPGMIAQGSGVIINNSSGWGIVGGDAAVAYCASKGGVVLLTKAMAIDHGRQGIRVNCICPGRRGYAHAAGRRAHARPKMGGLSGGLQQSSVGTDRHVGRDCESRAVSGVGRFFFHDRSNPGCGWRRHGGLEIGLGQRVSRRELRE